VQDTVETLKALVEAEMSMPRAEQVLLKGGVPLSPGASLSACAVVDNDFLFLVRDRGNGSSSSSTTSTSTSTSNATTSGSSTSTTAAATASVPTATVEGGAGLLRSLNDLPPGLGPEQFMTTLNDNPRLLAELKHHNGALAAAISSGDVVKVRSVQMKQKLQAMASRMEEQQALQALEANPMDPEAQRKIEEMIQKENVLRNMEAAMEEMPEAFGSVVMLYVDVEVNGWVRRGKLPEQEAGRG
jgi:DNA damage-inducible protein 1